mgnify:FL=1
MSTIALGHVPFGILGLISFGFPNLESLVYILASAFLHVCYMFFLLNAYRHAELSQVYPIARGLSPLIIVLVGTMFLGEYLSKYEISGILCVSIALILYGIKIGLKSRAALRGFYYAACTGCFIASYSVVDGYGVRVAQNAIGYTSTVDILSAALLCFFLLLFNKETFLGIRQQSQKTFWVGGSLGFSAYAIVLWACLHAPISIVYTLRETSVLFAILLAIVFLKEKITLSKTLLIGVLCFGVVLIKSSL